MTRTTFVRFAGVTVAAAAVGAFGLATPASAHVTISVGEVEAGSHARFDLRVPNESDEAGTNKLAVTLPEDAPLASVRTMAVPGWSVDTETRKLDEPLDLHGRQVEEVVSSITWTADDEDDEIAPGEFGEFPLSLGPIPDDPGTTLVFKVIQTYSDGEESPWIEAPQEGEAEPERPAPAVAVVEADDDDGHDDDGDSDDAADDEAADSDATATILGGVGAGLGAIALVVAVLAYRKRATVTSSDS